MKFSILSELPYPLKYVGKWLIRPLPLSIRYGKVFGETRKFLEESQWRSREQLEEYQLDQLSKQLNHAYEHVPYYTKIFDARGLEPKDIQDFEDLKQLPYLTKQDIQQNLKDLTARNYPRNKLLYHTTGGSTGTPTGFYFEVGVTDPKEQAFLWRFWFDWVGINQKDKWLTLRGTVFNRKDKDGNVIWWQHNPDRKELLLSSYHMTDDNLATYVEMIKKFKPSVIQGYPSSVDIFSSYLMRKNIYLEGLTAVLTSSENLYPAQRAKMEKYFGATVYDHYGNTERNVFAHQCEKAGLYHIIPEYGITEIIGKDGRDVKEEGAMGEIIATGFNNFAFPFIRYKTDDLGIWTNEKCSCGREHRFFKGIEGRLQELIVTKKGRYVSMVAINMHSDVFDNVKQCQFYQEKEGAVTFRVVKGDGHTEKDTEYIREELVKKLGDDVDLEIEFVDEIPRTKAGKYRWLIQKLDIGFGD